MFSWKEETCNKQEVVCGRTTSTDLQIKSGLKKKRQKVKLILKVNKPPST